MTTATIFFLPVDGRQSGIENMEFDSMEQAKKEMDRLLSGCAIGHTDKDGTLRLWPVCRVDHVDIVP